MSRRQDDVGYAGFYDKDTQDQSGKAAGKKQRHA